MIVAYLESILLPSETSVLTIFFKTLTLKTGSDKIIYWLGSYFSFWVLSCKNPKKIVILYSNQKINMEPLTFY